MVDLDNKAGTAVVVYPDGTEGMQGLKVPAAVRV